MNEASEPRYEFERCRAMYICDRIKKFINIMQIISDLRGYTLQTQFKNQMLYVYVTATEKEFYDFFRDFMQPLLVKAGWENKR